MTADWNWPFTNASKFWLIVVIGADDEIGAAGARLQAGIERLASRSVRARREEHGVAAHGGTGQHVLAAVPASGQLDPELYAEITGGQKTLMAGDQLDVAKSTARCSAQIGGRELIGRSVAVGRVAAVDVRHDRAEVPLVVGAIADAQVEIAIDRLVLDFLASTCGIDRRRLGGRNCSSAAAQLILGNEAVIEAQAPARHRRISPWRRRCSTNSHRSRMRGRQRAG